jgi:hypothetical protein
MKLFAPGLVERVALAALKNDARPASGKSR